MTDLRELSRQVFGSQLEAGPAGLQPGPEPLADLADAIMFAHPSGGARLDTEPEGDPDILLDYEALDEYQPTAQSIIAELDRANKDFHLDVEDILHKAKLHAGTRQDLDFPWESELVDRLVAKGYVVYGSETRLSAHRFSPEVHAYLASRAPSQVILCITIAFSPSEAKLNPGPAQPEAWDRYLEDRKVKVAIQAALAPLFGPDTQVVLDQLSVACEEE